MSKIVNKIVRGVINAFNHNDLEQVQAGTVVGGEPNHDIVPLLRRSGADGCVLLKNNNILPFEKSKSVAVFGRVQNDFFYVGNGSGGDVCTPYKRSLIYGLENCDGITINEDVARTYKQWCETKRNIPDPGFWGRWPRYYNEMPLSDSFVEKAAADSDYALVVIGRSAGEDRENTLEKGSYYLTDKEVKMLDTVTKYFKKTVLILNIGSVMDFEKINSYGERLGAIMIVWQGGMESGNSIADVLSGKVNPSGRLPDTIAKKFEDYPSSDCFGKKDSNNYIEDIFVGYRYFETFAPDKVLYEFGFGLSYTEFQISLNEAQETDGLITVSVDVKNTGSVSGREVAEIYASAPHGKLGKPSKVLVAFAKTKLLEPGEIQTLEFSIGRYGYSSFDDSGVTGNKNCYVLEKGEYSFFAGASVRKCTKFLSYTLDETIVLKQLSEVMAVKPGNQFNRFRAEEKDGRTVLTNESVPTLTTNLKDIITANLPESVEITGDKGYKLKDVKDGKVTLDDFVAQLSTDELELISRGEGPMNTPLGAKGNAGALGGVSQSLRDKGIPPMITTDGPSGIRLLTSCSLMPCGTALASTWDVELVEDLFDEMGKEMISRGSDILLAPGMNIHRNPLCGRNFEYYSEDPVISGKMASATVKGIQKNGVSACPKHFACNNQEFNRNHTDSVVSQRALREIYLKGFEICVKEASPHNIMTSYNKINGVWSHYNYELCTTVLRGEWQYKGNVMTDWWMRYAPSPEFPEMSGNAYRVRAQVDVLMPGAKTAVSKTFESDGTLLETYGREGGITLGEMQRTAKNVLNYIMAVNKL